MKRLFCLLALAAGLLSAQTITQSSSATTTGDKTDIPNMGANPAIGWRLTFWYTGFSSVTMQLDCAPDNGSGSAGSYAACSGAVDGTTNPVTVAATPQGGTIALKTYTPHIAVNISAVSGSGTVHWVLTGLWGAFNVPSTVTTSGGGGGGGTVQGICPSTAVVTLSGTGYNTIVATSGSTKITVCNVVYTSVSGGNPSVNTFTLAHGSCGGSPTTWAVLGGVTGYTDQFFGTLISSASDALCAKESVANSDVVTVTYLQQ